MKKRVIYPACMNAKEVLDRSLDDLWSATKGTRRLSIVTAMITSATIVIPIIKLVKNTINNRN